MIQYENMYNTLNMARMILYKYYYDILVLVYSTLFEHFIVNIREITSKYY